MGLSFTAYEAKAKFSELLRLVRAGRTVTISYHGKPVAEIRPLECTGPGLRSRLADLESRGLLTSPSKPRRQIAPVAKRPGALERFLAERD